VLFSWYRTKVVRNLFTGVIFYKYGSRCHNLLMSGNPGGMPTPEAALLDDSFIIRGHHLDYLTPLITPMDNDPEKMARDLREGSESERKGTTAATIDWDVITGRQDDDPRYWASYAYDLIGDTDVQGEEFESSLVSTFKSFLALADDAEIILTAQGLDAVCGACTFKKHCQVPQEMKEDAKYLDIFEDVLGYTKTKDDTLRVSAARLDNGDIRTTARTVRRVLGHFAIAKLWRINLYSDALERREKYGNVFGGPDKSDVERYYDSYGSEIV